MDQFSFNYVTKYYNDNIIMIQNKIIDEQWFRWQLIEICKILHINYKDSLGIEYSNELIVAKINKLKEQEQTYLRYIDEFKQKNPNGLQELGLELIDKHIPVPKIQLTKQVLNKRNMLNQWKQWSLTYIDIEDENINES